MDNINAHNRQLEYSMFKHYENDFLIVDEDLKDRKEWLLQKIQDQVFNLNKAQDFVDKIQVEALIKVFNVYCEDRMILLDMNSQDAKGLCIWDVHLESDLETFEYTKYKDVACSKCDTPLTKCICIGKKDDEEGHQWRMFCEHCWSEVSHMSKADIFNEYKPAELI